MSQKLDPVARRRRAVLLATLIILLVGVGVASDLSETISIVKPGMVLLLALVLAARVTTNLRMRRRDPALDDELTRANRAKAALAGFWTVMSVAGGILVSSYFLELRVVQVLLLLLIAGAAVAGIRFVLLEARLD